MKEYLIINLEIWNTLANSQEKLNELAKEGWEVISVIHIANYTVSYTLERLVIPKNEEKE